MKNLLNLFILTVILAAAVSAQSRAIVSPKSDSVKADAAQSVERSLSSSLTRVNFEMTGVQNDAGTCHKAIEQCVGNTFVLSGESEGYKVVMTITMNYNGFPSAFPANQLNSGTWSMVVDKDGSYYGTIYGDIQGGQINWTPDPNSSDFLSRSTDASLQITGGLDGYEGRSAESESMIDFSSSTSFIESSTFAAITVEL